MKAAPIIHCRTYSKDFDSRLLYSPVDFSDKEIFDIREKITQTTQEIRRIQEIRGIKSVRRVVITNNDRGVFGISCELSELIKKYAPEDDNLKKYVFDEFNRPVKAFIGLSFRLDDKNPGELPVADERIFFELFKELIAKDDVWFNNETAHYVSQYRDINACEYNGILAIENKKIGKYQVYSQSEDTDKAIFTYWLSKTDKDCKVMLCTDVSDAEKVLDGAFKIISASPDIIDKLSYNISKKEDEKFSEKAQNANEKETHSSFGNKKKQSSLNLTKLCMVAGAVIVTTAIVLIIHKILD